MHGSLHISKVVQKRHVRRLAEKGAVTVRRADTELICGARFIFHVRVIKCLLRGPAWPYVAQRGAREVHSGKVTEVHLWGE